MTTDRKVIIGVVLILIGGVLLLDNLRLFDFYIPYYFTRWYSILIYIGVFLILLREKNHSGIVLTAIGGIFLVSDVFNFHFWDLWPLALIAVGVTILLRRNQGDSYASTAEGGDDSDSLDDVVIFSGSEKYITSKNFRGGKITTIFGGADIDLRDAKLRDGKVVIDVFCLFGGSTLKVPSDWKVSVKVNPIFGGFTDKRVKLHDVELSDRELIITGTIIFGGGEIQS